MSLMSFGGGVNCIGAIDWFTEGIDCRNIYNQDVAQSSLDALQKSVVFLYTWLVVVREFLVSAAHFGFVVNWYLSRSKKLQSVPWYGDISFLSVSSSRFDRYN